MATIFMRIATVLLLLIQLTCALPLDSPHEARIDDGMVARHSCRYPTLKKLPQGAEPTICFNQGRGYARQWFVDMAADMCSKVKNREFNWQSGATGTWSYTHRNLEICREKLGAKSWQCNPPNNTLMTIDCTPTSWMYCDMGLSEAACNAGFATVYDGCNAKTLDNKQGGEYAGTGEVSPSGQLGSASNGDKGASIPNCLRFIIDPNYVIENEMNQYDPAPATGSISSGPPICHDNGKGYNILWDTAMGDNPVDIGFYYDAASATFPSGLATIGGA
ncbi:hypothetical protein LTR36_002288 [Oleoguttula mirabilis]|uniref:Uncharacterized protein n=1 Tax=Oleoguttula mirabilis TaxID=1507867 RepID=A0AAV9JMI6_9PEZI|nr:hypothetical protein LTR36_002288 [Oleoguttula mirabilis]